MTSYVLLILEPPGQRAAKPEGLGERHWQRMLDFAERLKADGKLRAGESLRVGGTRLMQDGGRLQTRDGPFAEARELVGGFFLFDCDRREDALRIAAECPAAEWATVELRETGPCFIA